MIKDRLLLGIAIMLGFCILSPMADVIAKNAWWLYPTDTVVVCSLHCANSDTLADPLEHKTARNNSAALLLADGLAHAAIPSNG